MQKINGFFRKKMELIYDWLKNEMKNGLSISRWEDLTPRCAREPALLKSASLEKYIGKAQK